MTVIDRIEPDTIVDPDDARRLFPPARVLGRRFGRAVHQRAARAVLAARAARLHLAAPGIIGMAAVSAGAGMLVAAAAGALYGGGAAVLAAGVFLLRVDSRM